jgi:hypothetical protein
MGIDRGILQTIKDHSKKISGPHFIFTAENPKHKDKKTLDLNNDQLIQHLGGLGLEAHHVHDKYGEPEKSVIVYGVSPKQAEGLHNIAAKLGQDSSLYSTGKNHELRYHHGENAGQSHYGSGTIFHEKEPQDNFTKLPNGQHFTHNFYFSTLRPSGQLGKSEKVSMPRKDFIEEHKDLVNTLKHPTKEKLEAEAKEQSEELKEEMNKEALDLIHYSHKPDLKVIDPKFKNTSVDSRTKGRDSEHPQSFYYRANTEPEDVVTSKSPHQYHTSIDLEKQPIYDMGEDKHGLVSQAIKENNGALNMDKVHSKLKEKGFHGYHNNRHPSLSNVVVIYHPLQVKKYVPGR